MGWCDHSNTRERIQRSSRLWKLVLLLSSLSLVHGRAKPWLPGQYPNPIKFPEACGRGDSVGWVCDPDHVLSKEDGDSVALLLQSIAASSTPYPPAYCAEQSHDGYPVAVALVRKLGTRFGRPMNIEAAHFADTLYNAWQMEYKSCKNGILLVLSVDDREAHLRVGNQLDPVLTRARLNSLAQKAKKQIALGDVFGAVKGTMHDAALLLDGFAQPVHLASPSRAWGFLLFFFGSAGIAFMVVYRFWLWLGRRRLRRAL